MSSDERDMNIPEDDRGEVDFEPEDELGTVGAAQAKLRKLKDELEEVKKERQEYLDGWQRCKADSVNARKDAVAAQERASARAQENLIEAIVPVIDSFDMAIESPAWEKVDATWRKGVESIRGQLISALETSGATHFGKPGENFDAQLHEALEEIDGGGAPGTIVRIVRRGWKTPNRVIRAAQVSVNKHES